MFLYSEATRQTIFSDISNVFYLFFILYVSFSVHTLTTFYFHIEDLINKIKGKGVEFHKNFKLNSLNEIHDNETVSIIVVILSKGKVL